MISLEEITKLEINLINLVGSYHIKVADGKKLYDRIQIYKLNIKLVQTLSEDKLTNFM